MGSGGCAPVGFTGAEKGKAPYVGLRAELPEADDSLCAKCYFEPVLRCIHDYTNQFSM